MARPQGRKVPRTYHQNLEGVPAAYPSLQLMWTVLNRMQFIHGFTEITVKNLRQSR
jgi:hypothetical protein